MKVNIEVESSIIRSPRVQQVEGIFDVPDAKSSRLTWDVDMPIEERDWNIGLICGPSGCGKSTIARKCFGDQLITEFDWPGDKSLLDGFPKGMPIKEIVGYLSSVGFSSPPSWLRPYHVLSNGQQFRVMMARILAEAHEIAVVDEFTSVVDRTVAQIGSAAIAKTVRRMNKRFVAVSCHMDIEEWLQPDWVYLPAEGKFTWRSLRRHPQIELMVNRAPSRIWPVFKPHHYLSGALNASATCFVYFWGERLVGFTSWLPHVGRLKDGRKGRRAHRTVVLPDFQGVSIGRYMVDHAASMWAGLGIRCFYGTGHPAEIANRRRSPHWRLIRNSGMVGKDGGSRPIKTRANDRLTCGFEWIGPAMDKHQAHACLENKCFGF